jgi:hypothetical protein
MPCKVLVNQNIRNAPENNTPHSKTASIMNYTNKLENRTPATTRAIQAKLLAFRASHRVHASEENKSTSRKAEKGDNLDISTQTRYYHLRFHELDDTTVYID